MTATHRNPLVALHQADALEGLAAIEAESVHCIVTSPPFWGLRSYSGEQERVWDAPAEGCEHEWGKEGKSGQRLRNGAEGGLHDGRTTNSLLVNTDMRVGAFCLRCPAWRGALGQEPTVELYVAHLMQVMAALRRVLRGDGVCWVNLDDTRQSGSYTGLAGGSKQARNQGAAFVQSKGGIRPKDMALVPERFILAAQAQGWWVRSKCVWAPLNPMPESAGDRPTDAYQMLYQLVKSERYWWDQEAVRENLTESSLIRLSQNVDGQQGSYRIPGKTNGPMKAVATGWHGSKIETPGRNTRNVQTWPTEGLGSFRVNGKTLTHFAAFPRALPNWCIRASCPATCCGRCGAGYARVVEKGELIPDQANPPRGAGLQKGETSTETQYRSANWWKDGYRPNYHFENKTVAFRPTCQCPQDLPTMPGLALDPFLGSGTTALASQELGRRCVGLDLSADYIALAWHRLCTTQPAMSGMG